jgi:hypothetical protein
VSLEPHRPDAVGIGWLQADTEVILSAGDGRRWELEPTERDIQLRKQFVRAVIAGQVKEAEGDRHSSLDVTLPDGTVQHSTVCDGLRGILMTRNASRTRQVYTPYR